ncbi:hypothetical protein CSUI_002790 [Cystoisospora suis]|uniref:Uncharacterized protein n=1 Tax=Cystoisospora suis TaxID=483139 RepID=A0A2C6L7D5_9APIC|nr:hypothetical protein CSUI_002790 [Cystoisospora suis]
MRSAGGKVLRSVTTPTRSSRGGEGGSAGTRLKGGRKPDVRKSDSSTGQAGEGLSEKDDITSSTGHPCKDLAASPTLEDNGTLETISQSDVVQQQGGTGGRTRPSVLLPSSSHDTRFPTHAESRHLPSESLHSPTFSSPRSFMSKASSSSSYSLLSTAHTDMYDVTTSTISSRSRSHTSSSSSPGAASVVLGRQQKKKEDSSPTGLEDSPKTADPSQLFSEPASSSFSLSHSLPPSHISRPSPRTRSSTVSTSFNLRSHVKPPVGPHTRSSTTSLTPPQDEPTLSLSVAPSSPSLPSSDAIITQGEKDSSSFSSSPHHSGCIDSASRGGGSGSVTDGNSTSISTSSTSSSTNPSNSHKKRTGGRGGGGAAAIGGVGLRCKKSTLSPTVKSSPVKAVWNELVSEGSPSLSSLSSTPPSLVTSSRSSYETRMKYSSQASANVSPSCILSKEAKDEEISASSSSRSSRDIPTGTVSQAKAVGGGGIVTRSHNKGLATGGGGDEGGVDKKKDRPSRSGGNQLASPRSLVGLASGRSIGMSHCEEGISDVSHVQKGEGLHQGKKQEDDSHSTSSSCSQEGGEAIGSGVHTAGETSPMVATTGRRERVEVFQRDGSSRVKHHSVSKSLSIESMKNVGESDDGSMGRIQEGTAVTSSEKDDIGTKSEVDGRGMVDDVDTAPGSSGVYTPHKSADTKVVMGRQEFNLRSRVQRRGGPVKGEDLMSCHSSVCTTQESGDRIRSKTKEESQVHSNAPTATFALASSSSVSTAEGTGEGGEPLEKTPSQGVSQTAGGRRISERIQNSQKKSRRAIRSNANSLSSEGEGREDDAVSMSDFPCSVEFKEVFQGDSQQQTSKNLIHQMPSVDTPERKEEKGRIYHCPPSMPSSSSSDSRCSLAPQSPEEESEPCTSVILPSPSKRSSRISGETSSLETIQLQDVSSPAALTEGGGAVTSPRQETGVHTPPQEIGYNACISSTSQGEKSRVSLPKSKDTAGVCTPERLVQLPSRLLQDRRLVAASPSSQSSVGSNLGLDSRQHQQQMSPSQSPSPNHLSFFTTPSSPPPPLPASFSHGDASEDNKPNTSLSSSSHSSTTSTPNTAVTTALTRRTRRRSSQASPQSISSSSSSLSSSSVSSSQNSFTSPSVPCSSPSSTSFPVLASSLPSSASSPLLSSSSSSSSSSVTSSSDTPPPISSFSPSPLGKLPEPLSEGETTKGLRRSLRQRQVPHRCQATSVSSSSASLISSPLPSRSQGEGSVSSESSVFLSSCPSSSSSSTGEASMDTNSASTRSSHTKSSVYTPAPLLPPAASSTGGKANQNKKKVSSLSSVAVRIPLGEDSEEGGGGEEKKSNKIFSNLKKEENPGECPLGINPPSLPSSFLLGSSPISSATGFYSSSSFSLVTECSSLKNTASPPGEKENACTSQEMEKHLQASCETAETSDAKAPPRPASNGLSRRTEGEHISTRSREREEGEGDGGLESAVNCQEIEGTSSSSSLPLESSGEGGGERVTVSTRKKKNFKASSRHSSPSSTSLSSLAGIKTGEEEEGRGVRKEDETFSTLPPAMKEEEEEDRRTVQETIEKRSEQGKKAIGGREEENTSCGGRMMTRAVVMRIRRGGEGGEEEEKREMSGGGSTGLRRSERHEAFHLPGEATSHDSTTTTKSSSTPLLPTHRQSKYAAGIPSKEEIKEDSSSSSPPVGGGSEKVTSTSISQNDLLPTHRHQGEMPNTTPQSKPPPPPTTTTSSSFSSSSPTISSPSLLAKSTPPLPPPLISPGEKHQEGARSSHSSSSSSSSVCTPRSSRRQGGGGLGGGGGTTVHTFNGLHAKTPGASSSSSFHPSHHLSFSHITTRSSAAAAAASASTTLTTAGGGGERKLQGDAYSKAVGGGGVANASTRKQKGSGGGAGHLSHIPSHAPSQRGSHSSHSGSIPHHSHSSSCRASSSLTNGSSSQSLSGGGGGGGGGGRRVASKASAAATAAALARQQKRDQQQEEGRKLCDLVKFDVSWFVQSDEDEDDVGGGGDKEIGMGDEKDLESSHLFEPRERRFSLRRRAGGQGDKEDKDRGVVVDWESYWLRPLSPVRRVDMMDETDVSSSSSYPVEGIESSSMARDRNQKEQTASLPFQRQQEEEEKKKEKEKEGYMLLSGERKRAGEDEEKTGRRERNEERGEQDGDILRKKEDFRGKDERKEDRCRREEDEAVLILKRRRERQKPSHCHRRALLAHPSLDHQERQRRSPTQEKEAEEEGERRKELKSLNRHLRPTSVSDEELLIEGREDLDEEETLSFMYDDEDLEGYLSDVMKASAVCTPHPCEREGEIKLKVPRCCYCRLPRRIPSYKESFYQNLEERLPGFLRLFCVCPARKFGDSCLQGSAGREGLVLPHPSQSLFYSVRSVGREGEEEEQERREETDLSDLEGDETDDEGENDSLFADSEGDHRADEDKNEEEEKRKNLASSVSLSAERSRTSQVCIESSLTVEREGKPQKSPAGSVDVEEEEREEASSSCLSNHLFETKLRGEEDVCLDRNDRSEGKGLDTKSIVRASEDLSYLSSVGKEERAREELDSPDDKNKKKTSKEKDDQHDEKKQPGEGKQGRLREDEERRILKRKEESHVKQIQIMEVHAADFLDDKTCGAKEQEENEKSTRRRTGDPREEEKKEEKEGQPTIETLEKRTISSSLPSEERRSGERERASHHGAKKSHPEECRERGERQEGSHRKPEELQNDSHRSTSAKKVKEIREMKEKDMKRKREESCLRNKKKRKRRRKELIFRWRDPSTLQCYSSSLDLLQGSISALSASARVASSISSVPSLHTSSSPSTSVSSREKEQREKNVASSSSFSLQAPHRPVVFLPRVFYEKESDCYIASCLVWRASDTRAKITEKEKKKNISCSSSCPSFSSSSTPLTSSSSLAQQTLSSYGDTAGHLSHRGDEGHPFLQERENTKTCINQKSDSLHREESRNDRRDPEEEGEKGRGLGKEEEKKKKVTEKERLHEGEREGRERDSHSDSDHPDGSSVDRTKDQEEEEEDTEEEKKNKEKEEEEEEVSTGLKLLQKRFSVGFLGHSKAHFYASEWLRWQYEQQKRLLLFVSSSLQQKTTEEISSRHPSDLYPHGSWSCSSSFSFPLDLPGNSVRRYPYYRDLGGGVSLKGRGGGKAHEARLLLSSLDALDDMHEDFYEGRGDEDDEIDGRYQDLLHQKSTPQGRKGGQVKKGSSGIGGGGSGRLNGSPGISFLKSSSSSHPNSSSSSYHYHHQSKHLYSHSLHSSSSSLPLNSHTRPHGVSQGGSKSLATGASTRGGGSGGAGTSKNAAAFYTPEDLSSLTPEELELLRKRQETRERQKRQKLLRQQWRRQQAREAKLRMMKEQERAGGDRNPQGETKSSSASSSNMTSQNSESHPTPGPLIHPAPGLTTSLSPGLSSQRDRGVAPSILQEKGGGREGGDSQGLRNHSTPSATSHGSTAGSRSSGALVKMSSSKTIPAGGTRGGAGGLHHANHQNSKKDELASLGVGGERRRAGEREEEKRGEKGIVEKESPRRKLMVTLRSSSLSSSTSTYSGGENMKNNGGRPGAGGEGDREKGGMSSLLSSSSTGVNVNHRKRTGEEGVSSSSLPPYQEESHRGAPSLSSPVVPSSNSPSQGSSKRMKVTSLQGPIEKNSSKKDPLGFGGDSAAIGEGREGGKGDGSIGRASGVHTPGFITTTTRGGMCTRNQLASSTRSSSSSQMCFNTSSSLSSSTSPLPTFNSSSLLSHESSSLSTSQATRAKSNHLEGTSLSSSSSTSLTSPEEKAIESMPSSSSCPSSRVTTKGKVNTRRTTASSSSPQNPLSTSSSRKPAATEDISGVSGGSSVYTVAPEGTEGEEEKDTTHSREGGRGPSRHRPQGIPLNVKKSEISSSSFAPSPSSACSVAASAPSSSFDGNLLPGGGKGEKPREDIPTPCCETFLNTLNVSPAGETEEMKNGSRRLRSGRVLRSARQTDEEKKISSSSSSPLTMPSGDSSSSSSQGLSLSSSSAVGGPQSCSSSSSSSS